MEARRRRGQPVERVRSTETDEDEKGPQLVEKWKWFLVVGSIIISFIIVDYFENFRPKVVPSTDFSRFSEERARETTKNLSEIGPRPSGSHALEVIAFQFLKDKINKIEKSALNSQKHRLELSIQRPSGCFDVDFTNLFTECYHKISNIVVRMGPASRPQSNDAFLLNCHFDSQVDAPGATDDAVSCAIMLDIMEIIARGEAELKNDVIFLFNGAEESCLQGAHGFITQHPWRHAVRAYLNLEGAGAGGREVLFQTGPGNPWLSDVYARSVPHPSCSILGQELFQSRIIPSDTDFRIFRDFGRVSGLDIAYFRNGWVYHTEFDEHQRIAEGDIQRTGENILALVWALDNSEYLRQPGRFEDKTKVVFFDILGRWVFRCSLEFALFINVLTITWTVYSIVRNANPYFFTAFLISLANTFIPFCLIFVIGGKFLGFQFFWHKGIGLAMIYFLTHVLGGLYVNYSLVGFDKKKRLLRADAFYDAFNAILVLLLILFMLPEKMRGSSLYQTLFILIWKAKDVIEFLFRRFTSLSKAQSTFYSISLTHIPFTVLYFYLTSMILYLFVPILGRMGAKVASPDMVLLLATNALFSVFVWSLAPLIYLTNWKSSISSSRSLLSRHFYPFIYITVILLLLSVTSLGNSYEFDEKMPKLRRIQATHMNRVKYNFNGSIMEEINGILVQGLDFRKSDDLPTDDVIFAKVIPVYCGNYMDEGCGLPYWVPRTKIFLPQDAKIIPTSKIAFSNPIQLHLTKKKVLENGKRRLEFMITGGSDKIGLHVSPSENVRFTNSSLTYESTVLNSGKTFFATLGHGYEHPGDWRFWFEMEGDGGERSLEIVIFSQNVHGEAQYSKELMDMKKKVQLKRREKDWRWMMTIVSSTADVKVYDF